MGQIHKSAALTNLSIGYKNQNFIADRVFPNVPVAKESDYYYKFLKGAWFRDEARAKGPGADAARGHYPLTAELYKCIKYAFAHPVPIEHINNADAALDPWRTAIEFTVNKILLHKEKKCSDLVMTAANWTSSEDANAGWVATVDGTGNTFIEDMLAAKETIRKLIGAYPNVMIMDSKTFNNCKREYTVLERIKYTGTQGRPADVTVQTLAQLFELDQVLIGTALYSDAEEVVAGTDFNAVDLWETNATKGSCFLFWRPNRPGLLQPASGYCFNFKQGMAGGQDRKLRSDVYRQVRYWWEDSPEQYVVECQEYFDLQVTCKDAGFLFYDTIVT
jgi:hypothetical protein